MAFQDAPLYYEWHDSPYLGAAHGLAGEKPSLNLGVCSGNCTVLRGGTHASMHGHSVEMSKYLPLPS